MLTQEDKKLLKELGMEGMAEEHQAQGLRKFYETLELKAGMALEDKLSDEQIMEFEKVSQAGDDQATGNWLKRAVPDFKQVVAKEKAELVKEIRQSVAKLA